MLNEVKSLMAGREENIKDLTERNNEINTKKSEITALFEQAEAMNRELKNLLDEV